MYPLKKQVLYSDDLTKWLVENDQYIELLTIFPDKSDKCLDFLDSADDSPFEAATGESLGEDRVDEDDGLRCRSLSYG